MQEKSSYAAERTGIILEAESASFEQSVDTRVQSMCRRAALQCKAVGRFCVGTALQSETKIRQEPAGLAVRLHSIPATALWSLLVQHGPAWALVIV